MRLSLDVGDKVFIKILKVAKNQSQTRSDFCAQIKLFSAYSTVKATLVDNDCLAQYISIDNLVELGVVNRDFNCYSVLDFFAQNDYSIEISGEESKHKTAANCKCAIFDTKQPQNIIGNYNNMQQLTNDIWAMSF